MTEIYTYRCDVCGKCFDNREDCRKHEMEHTMSHIKNAVVMADSSRNVISLDDLEEAIDKAYFIYIGNQGAANQLEEIFQEYGFTFPAEDAQEKVSYPALFAYQNNERYWKSFQDIENEYNEFLAVKDEMEDLLQ